MAGSARNCLHGSPDIAIRYFCRPRAIHVAATDRNLSSPERMDRRRRTEERKVLMSKIFKSKRIVHDPEFKKQAVQMLNTSGRPLGAGSPGTGSAGVAVA